MPETVHCIHLGQQDGAKSIGSISPVCDLVFPSLLCLSNSRGVSEHIFLLGLEHNQAKVNRAPNFRPLWSAITPDLAVITTKITNWRGLELFDSATFTTNPFGYESADESNYNTSRTLVLAAQGTLIRWLLSHFYVVPDRSSVRFYQMAPRDDAVTCYYLTMRRFRTVASDAEPCIVSTCTPSIFHRGLGLHFSPTAAKVTLESTRPE